MTTRDLASQVALAISLNPANRQSNVNGAGVDLKGYDSAAVMFMFGAWTDGIFAATIEESDDDVTYTAVASGDRSGTLPNFATSNYQNTVNVIHYLGAKRYIRPVLTLGGGSPTAGTGINCAAYVLKGHPHIVVPS